MFLDKMVKRCSCLFFSLGLKRMQFGTLEISTFLMESDNQCKKSTQLFSLL